MYYFNFVILFFYQCSPDTRNMNKLYDDVDITRKAIDYLSPHILPLLVTLTPHSITAKSLSDQGRETRYSPGDRGSLRSESKPARSA